LGFDPSPVMFSTKCMSLLCILPGDVGPRGCGGRDVGLVTCGAWLLGGIEVCVAASWLSTCFAYCLFPH
jgi:hypothetical protein